MLTSWSSPARTSTTCVIGKRKAGLDSVISYLPGARSSGGAGVMVGWIASILPVATFLIAVTSPHGKALMATRPGTAGITAADVCRTGFSPSGRALLGRAEARPTFVLHMKMLPASKATAIATPANNGARDFLAAAAGG